VTHPKIPALVACDVDGTLFDENETITPRTRDAVRAAVDAGARFIVATGRPPRWIRPVVDELGFTPMAVCANGAVVYDSATDRVVSARTLAVDVLGELAEIYGVKANEEDLKLTLADYFDIHLDHAPKEGAELALDSIVLVARSIGGGRVNVVGLRLNQCSESYNGCTYENYSFHRHGNLDASVAAAIRCTTGSGSSPGT